MQVDTSSPAYQNLLVAITTIHNQLRNNYGPVLKRMNKQQLIHLYQNDPIFAKCVDISKDMTWLAEKVGIEL